ncbi:MAG: hypothetical protein V7695_12485 [Sulfitobacter sp.]
MSFSKLKTKYDSMNLSQVVMTLGTFRFGLSNGGYQELSREVAYRWNKVDRLGRPPALEGMIYPHFKGE